MATSKASEIKKIINMKTRKFFALFSLVILSTTGSFAQPAWFGGAPTVTPHVFSEDFTYGINMPGKVYVLLFNYNIGAAYSSAIIKAAALGGPSTTIISTWVINVPLADINTVISINALNQLGGNIPLISGHDYTFYLVAEDAGGNLQAAPVRIMIPTLPCPAIGVATNLIQPVVCIKTQSNIFCCCNRSRS